MSVITASSSQPRFRTLDGLRGIAAASVVVFHFNGVIERFAHDWLPAWAAAIARHGDVGVEMFFVISGFVIAFSVRDGNYSGRYLGLFALRRSIRLDPPYWFAIAIELALIAATAAFFPSLKKPLPGAAPLVAHLFYAQGILGYGDVLGVFWTLCFEIQFYLFFVLLLVGWKKTEGRWTTLVRRRVAGVALSALFVASIGLAYAGRPTPIHGLALARWFQFFLGVLTWWALSSRISLRTLFAADATIVVSLLVYRPDPVQIVPVLVSAFIIFVGRRDALDRTLGARPLQFLGKISYSLYLLHGPIGERWIALVERLVGPRFGTGWAWLTFISASAIAVIAATIVWRAIEAPTTRFSKRIVLPTRTAPKAIDAEVPVPSVVEAA